MTHALRARPSLRFSSTLIVPIVVLVTPNYPSCSLEECYETTSDSEARTDEIDLDCQAIP